MNDLAQGELPADPHALFARWYEEASACEQIMYAGATCLSTVDLEGWPDGRIVLLHAVDASGFVFFTDARSRKGRALAQRPEAALTLYWGPLERQVRVQGRVEHVSEETADAFFERRPRRSQGTAWASAQSRPLESRAALDRRMEEVDARFEERSEIPRPPYWRAYRVCPRRIEFWAAGARRLHDRVLYAKAGDGWTVTRLFP